MSSSPLFSLQPQQIQSHLPPHEIFVRDNDDDDRSIMTVSKSCETPPSVKFFECPTDERRLSIRLQQQQQQHEEGNRCSRELPSPRVSAKKFTFDDYHSPMAAASAASGAYESESREFDVHAAEAADQRMEHGDARREQQSQEATTTDYHFAATTPKASKATASTTTWRVGQLMKKQSPDQQQQLMMREDSTSVPPLSWYCCVMETLGGGGDESPLDCMMPKASQHASGGGGLCFDNDATTTSPPRNNSNDTDDDDDDDVIYAYGPNNTRLELEMELDTNKLMVIGALPTVPEEGESLLSDDDDDDTCQQELSPSAHDEILDCRCASSEAFSLVEAESVDDNDVAQEDTDGKDQMASNDPTVVAPEIKEEGTRPQTLTECIFGETVAEEEADGEEEMASTFPTIVSPETKEDPTRPQTVTEFITDEAAAREEADGENQMASTSPTIVTLETDHEETKPNTMTEYIIGETSDEQVATMPRTMKECIIGEPSNEDDAQHPMDENILSIEITELEQVPSTSKVKSPLAWHNDDLDIESVPSDEMLQGQPSTAEATASISLSRSV